MQQVVAHCGQTMTVRGGVKLEGVKGPAAHRVAKDDLHLCVDDEGLRFKKVLSLTLGGGVKLEGIKGLHKRSSIGVWGLSFRPTQTQGSPRLAGSPR